jgi:hypothetical protein
MFAASFLVGAVVVSLATFNIVCVLADEGRCVLR